MDKRQQTNALPAIDTTNHNQMVKEGLRAPIVELNPEFKRKDTFITEEQKNNLKGFGFDVDQPITEREALKMLKHKSNHQKKITI